MLQSVSCNSIRSFRFSVKHSYVFLKNFGDFPKPNRTDTIYAIFIFLNLLKGNSQAVCQTFLGEPRQLSIISDICAYNIIKLPRLPFQWIPSLKNYVTLSKLKIIYFGCKMRGLFTVMHSSIYDSKIILLSGIIRMGATNDNERVLSICDPEDDEIPLGLISFY